MPAWIHERAKHIQDKNPDMPESRSFAIATQQAYAAGKAPKKFGASKGRKDAKEKYDSPKSHYIQTAKPKSAGIDPKMFLEFSKEVGKITKTPNKVTEPKTKLPKLTSKQRFSPEAESIDHIGSLKMIPPPPLTMSSGG